MARVLAALVALSTALVATNVVAASTHTSMAAVNPCGAVVPSGMLAKVAAQRRAGKRVLPAAVWRALESGGYYVCTVSRTKDGKLAATSFKLPIGRVGQRVWFRVLFQPDSPSQAASLAAAIRSDPKAFIRSLGGGGGDFTRGSSPSVPWRDSS